MKDPIEVRSPGGNFVPVVLCMEMSRNHISIVQLDNVPLDLCHSPGIGSKTSSTSHSNVRFCCNSRRQLLDRLAHGVVEVVQLLPVQSPVEDGTDFSAGQPEFDIIHPISHPILGTPQSAIGQQETRRKLTLIIVRTTLTEPKTAFAGVILEISFARFMASMTAFNVETTLSRSFGR